MAEETNKSRPLFTKRGVNTKKADEAKSPQERLAALNETLQSIPFSHNEARRLTQMMLNTITEILTEKK
jgi:hypothetical protein